MQARRRVREAQARANETRAQREHANIEDAATYMVAVGKISEVDTWEAQRLAIAEKQICAEADRKRAQLRNQAGAAIARIKQRGEALSTIAALAGTGVGEIRAMLRYAPRLESETRKMISGALDDGLSSGHLPGKPTGTAGDVERGAAAGA